MRKWVAFYANGTTFTSEQGTFAESPETGLVIIAQERPVGENNNAPLIMGTCSFWAAHDGRIWHHDIHGLMQWAIEAGHVREDVAGIFSIQIANVWTPRGEAAVARLLSARGLCRIGVYVDEAAFKVILDAARGWTF